MVEAGLRLHGIGNDAIQFYAGIYYNGGRGEDDLRLFAGLLFKLEKLADILK